MLFSRLTWAVRGVRDGRLAYLSDSYLPAGELLFFIYLGARRAVGAWYFGGSRRMQFKGDEVGSC